MKIDNSVRSSGLSGGVRASTAVRTGGGVDSPVAVLPQGDVASLADLHLSPQELTPRVREVVLALLAEVAALRQELDSSSARLTEMEKLADQDTLSPIANRRAFVRELSRVMSYAQRYRVPTSILFFDVNGLKQINDTLGHAAGDAVLTYVAGTLSANVRGSDVVGRLGGDEYAVVLTHASAEQAAQKADQLTTAVAATPVLYGDQALQVRVAVGSYTLGPEENPLEVLAKADALMYRHKQTMKAQG